MKFLILSIVLISCTVFTSGESSVESPDENIVLQTLGLTKLAVDTLRPHTEAYRQALPAIVNSPIFPTDHNFQKEAKADYVTCEACSAGVGLMKLVSSIITDPAVSDLIMTEVVIQACQILKLVDDELTICRPAVKSFAPPVLRIIRDKPTLTTDDFCGILFTGCGNVNPDLTDWTIIIDGNKPEYQTPAPLPATTPKTSILQFTDIHLDLDYIVGSNGYCGRPAGCCRDGEGEGTSFAGKYGHFGCALPEPALDSLFEHAKTISPAPKYIYLTGDYIHSTIWLYNVQENTRHLQRVTEKLADAFPTTPIYPVPGNHEADTCNLYPPKALWNDFDLSWMYKIISAPFLQYIPVDQHTTLLDGGFYTVKPDPDVPFRIITLNTNICYLQNFWLVYETIDPMGQLQWFADTLLKAEQDGEFVHVLGHIMPGSGSCWPVWSEQYDRIIKRFHGIIQAQFFGHQHRESYALTADKDLKPISVSYSGPSGVTDAGNPSYKVYEVDGERAAASTFEIMDHKTYILDITKSNAQNKPIVEELFSAKNEFGLESLRPTALYDLVERMVSDNALFKKYLRTHHRGAPSYNPCEDKACRANALCDLVETNSNDASACEKVKELVEEGFVPEATSPKPGGGSGAFLFQPTQIILLFVTAFAFAALN